jgi:very-long-chain (3R)-3-hydroxyacyl-CoA dehydratase
MSTTEVPLARGAPTQRAPGNTATPKAQYLTVYNLVSSMLWAIVLGRTLILSPQAGTSGVYNKVGEYTKWVQTLALLEVVHSLVG